MFFSKRAFNALSSSSRCIGDNSFFISGKILTPDRNLCNPTLLERSMKNKFRALKKMCAASKTKPSLPQPRATPARHRILKIKFENAKLPSEQRSLF
jgi:hypothetical protein